MQQRSSGRRMMGCAVWVVATGLCATVAGCGGKTQAPSDSGPAARPAPTPPQHRPQTRPAVSRRGGLYERLGGEAVVRAVVDDFVSRAAADPAVNFRREGHPNSWQPTPQNIERLKQRLVEFIATTAGGPMQYRGNDMVTAHRGMAITNAEFDALAGHLGAALQANDVPRREREELMKAVASTRGAIVEAAGAPPADATNTPDTGATDASPPADPAPTDATPPEAPGDGTPPEQTPPVDAPAPETADPNEPETPSPVEDPKPEGAESAAPEQGAPPTPDPRL